MSQVHTTLKAQRARNDRPKGYFYENFEKCSAKSNLQAKVFPFLNQRKEKDPSKKLNFKKRAPKTEIRTLCLMYYRRLSKNGNSRAKPFWYSVK